jgi:hypothetical protein
MVQILEGRLHDVDLQLEVLESEKKKHQTTIQDLEDQ